MTENERFGALLAATLVIGTCALIAWARRGPEGRVRPDAPVVGRTAAEIAGDPAGSFDHVRASTGQEIEARRQAAAFEALDPVFEGVAWPGPWRAIVVHALEEGLPSTDQEEGDPWHAVLDPDGRTLLTERGRRGRPGVPPSFPPAKGIRAWHVMVPQARSMSPARKRALGDLLAYLCHRLGIEPQRILLAGEQPDSGPSLPEGVDRETLLPEEWVR